MTVLSNTSPKARKQHRCNFCYEVIQSGEVYNNQTNVYDGNLYRWKSHVKCSDIANELNMYDNCDEGLTGDDFCEDIKQTYMSLQREINLEHYESKDFKYPRFKDQLQFVCDQKLTITKPIK